MDMFRKIHAQDSHAKLFLNEYGIVVNANKAVVSFLFVLCVLFLNRNMSRVIRNPVLGVSDKVRHQRDCTTTKDSKRLEIFGLGSRGIVLSM